MPETRPRVRMSNQRNTGQRIPMRGRYDAAQSTDENIRHWSYADALSANSSNSAMVRGILRRRARYECANNTYCRGMVLTLANEIVRTGPRLQMVTEDPAVNELVEYYWDQWAKQINLAQKLRTLRMARCVDGEAFARKVTNLKLKGPVKLDLRLYEADQVASPWGATITPTDGIIFDDFGNPMAYSILRRHPGETFTPISGFSDYGQADNVPADQICHLFRRERPGQTRGVPEITAALPLFAMLRRYTLAVIAAAETAADVAAVLQTNAPPDDGADPAEPWDTVEIERRSMMTLPMGWTVGQIDSKQPTTTYGDFKRQIISEIGRCLNMPYNIAAADSSAYNYASGRLDHQVFDGFIAVDRQEVEADFMDSVQGDFITELSAAARNDPSLGINPQAAAELPDAQHQWFWPTRGHSDPTKDADADDKRLSDGTLTYPRYWSGQGEDWRKMQVEQAEALGITVKEYQKFLAQKLFAAGGSAPGQQPSVQESAA